MYCQNDDDIMIKKIHKINTFLIELYANSMASCYLLLNYLLAFSCFIIFCSWQVSKTMKEDADEDIAKYDG